MCACMCVSVCLCVCFNVCMYACLSVCVCVDVYRMGDMCVYNMCARLSVWLLCVCVCICERVCRCECVGTCMRVFLCAHASMLIWYYVDMHVYLCARLLLWISVGMGCVSEFAYVGADVGVGMRLYLLVRVSAWMCVRTCVYLCASVSVWLYYVGMRVSVYTYIDLGVGRYACISTCLCIAVGGCRYVYVYV